MPYDLIVLGGGLTACAASTEAARRGERVLQVPVAGADGDVAEARSRLFRALLHEAAGHALRQPGCAETGAREGRGAVRALRERSEVLLRKALAEAYAELGRAGVAVREGRPRLLEDGRLELEGERLSAASVVLATGCRPRRPKRFPFDGRTVLDADTAWRLEDLPSTLLVVGAEEAGCALAANLAALGASVTLLDRRTRLFRYADREILEFLHGELRRLGVTVVLGEGVRELRAVQGGARGGAEVWLESGRCDRFDATLVAAGRQPAVEGLGLEAAGVERDPQGFVSVDECFRSSRPGVFALGSVAGDAGGHASARHQAAQALRAARGETPFEWGDPVRVLETQPPLAMAGLTQEACERLDVPCRSVTLPYGEVLRGRLRGERGLLKLVVSEGGERMLGVHAIGAEADELVHLGAAWMRAERPLEGLLDCSFAPGRLAALYAHAALELRPRGPAAERSEESGSEPEW